MSATVTSVTDGLRRLLKFALRFARVVRRWYLELGPGGAERRGMKLLRQWLAPEQLAQYDAHNYFEVIGCDSGKRYRIHYGVGTNVCELDERGQIKAGWCFVPKGSLVAGDVMLVQKIALETQESSALAVAEQFTPSWY